MVDPSTSEVIYVLNDIEDASSSLTSSFLIITMATILYFVLWNIQWDNSVHFISSPLLSFIIKHALGFLLLENM